MSRDLKYIGMDVHKEAIVMAVLNGSGKLVMKSIIETKPSSILQFIHGLRGELHVTWEEGTWAAWLYDLLPPQVAQVLVCDPQRNALLGRAKHPLGWRRELCPAYANHSMNMGVWKMVHDSKCAESPRTDASTQQSSFENLERSLHWRSQRWTGLRLAMGSLASATLCRL